MDYMNAPPDAVRSWQEGRFGIFIHWDVASLARTAQSWGRHGPRPGCRKPATGGVPREEYDNLYRQFDPAAFDGREWAALFKAAGARYVVFTAKHHAGFCMYDSAHTDYDIMSAPIGRDLGGELARACQEEGLAFGWYYSQPDWYHPDYLTAAHDRYKLYLRNQLHELLSKYGTISVLWFDGLGKSAQTWDAPELFKMARSLQPHILINKRCGLPGDFDTRELRVGRFDLDRPWEHCTIIGSNWNWTGGREVKSPRTCIRLLVRTVGAGGNLLLDTGPKPDGTIPEAERDVLRAMGAWLSRHGESIYGTVAGPYMPGPWGVSTRKGDTVYLHVLQRWAEGADGTLRLPPLPLRVVRHEAVSGALRDFRQDDSGLCLTFDTKAHNPTDTIVKLEVAGDAGEIAPIEVERRTSLSVGAAATASSGTGKSAPDALTGANRKQFDEGALIKAAWSPRANDKAPWVEIDFGRTATFDHVILAEHVRAAGTKGFRIEHADGGEWRTLFAADEPLGQYFSLRCAPTAARKMRFTITRSDGRRGLVLFDVYPAAR